MKQEQKQKQNPSFFAMVIITIAVMIGYSYFTSFSSSKKENIDKVSIKQKELLFRLIKANGYSCTQITKAQQSSYNGNWRVYCGENNAYDANKEGEIWKIIKLY